MVGELAGDQPRKRIAIFLDGTWNTTNDNTNVWRLRALTAPLGADQVRQSIYYNAGLGTQVGSKVRGGMFGVGIDDILLESYQWLVENYNDGDDIFIFGFSRGSYTARSLSGFVSRCGVLKPGGPLSIRQLYDRYRLGLTVPSIERLINHPPKNPTLEESWLVRYSRFVNIKFLGVFDTVGSLGVPLGISRFKKSHSFLNTSLRTPNIAAAHALAIDEHRPDFAPTLWTRSVPKDPDADQPRAPRSVAEAEQRWFVGAHANVGGGYSNDLLSQRPFAWMMKRAAAQGLSFRSDVDQFSPTIRSPVIDSYGSFLGGFYRYLQREHQRSIGADPIDSRTAVESSINESIDGSVFERWQSDETYRPKNLSTWAERKKADLTKISGSVRTDDLSQVPND
ncbi:DUF2235 domain-containing protein [Bradyrhizobium barranii]|uniref:DUF2235 domain-containing protein n=1 Tax=Bradyrhizobium barranii TaxID=2992140 RepID=A0ABY3QGH9_9BRAD|nr:DUF2235 domain-containing protein [Bradyrhizobium japonicum]MCS3898520.1 uncharacterized protein (DUF2235 family) [Bradyrhizobium japonicum USDA 38]MCS3941573.1 uncharacterized protein (DUF2235 family) [Bradyrhizobium japonicum]UFW85069.1 DUF2235 domain-containing protein [Bradyrhizobium japonicum]